jgi:hypothetical protein
MLVVGLVMVLGACSGDDGTAEYLDEVAAAFRRMEADTFAALPRTAEPTRERITGVADALSTRFKHWCHRRSSASSTTRS